jgi:hypothetical protein
MANHLEHEFPAVRWRAVPAQEIDRELVRRYVERGRQLRSEAIRRGGRAVVAALGRAAFRVVTLVRCTRLSLGGRPDAGDCWRGSTRSA